MKPLKVMTVVGTRPEIIRLSRVIPALDEAVDHVLVHTGQNYDYELNEIFFEDLAIRRPDHNLAAASGSPAATIARVIERADELLQQTAPDALLVLGDTNSCFAALAAKRRRVVVFHMEAGNRSFDDRVPEEINRRIIDRIADINLPYSDIARGYLLREGQAADRVITTGSPMREVLHYYAERIERSTVLETLRLTPERYFVVSAHREENVDPEDQLERLVALLEFLATEYELPVIVSTHPRTRKRLEETRVPDHSLIRFLKPLKYTDYVRLQRDAKATLSDSGTISEESSILNFPALNIREAHERPEAMEEASVMLVGFSADRVAQGLKILERQPRGAARLLLPVQDYMAPSVSAKIVRLIVSYTDYVRRTVWQMRG